jgi:hypothetical protein
MQIRATGTTFSDTSTSESQDGESLHGTLSLPDAAWQSALKVSGTLITMRELVWGEAREALVAIQQFCDKKLKGAKDYSLLRMLGIGELAPSEQRADQRQSYRNAERQVKAVFLGLREFKDAIVLARAEAESNQRDFHTTAEDLLRESLEIADGVMKRLESFAGRAAVLLEKVNQLSDPKAIKKERDDLIEVKNQLNL